MQQAVTDLLFGSQDSTATVEDEAEAEEPDPSEALRPFTSLLSIGDVEGTYLVAAEDRPVAEMFLGEWPCSGAR